LSAFNLLLWLVSLAPAAQAQTVDACTVFTAAMGQAIVGKPVVQGRSAAAKTNSYCEYVDASKLEFIRFILYRMGSGDEAARYMQAEMKAAVGVRGGSPEKLDGIGDEAYYLPTTWSVFVRKGAVWFSFGHMDRKPQLIELARKVAPTL
jgi:hypothetical protein